MTTRAIDYGTYAAIDAVNWSTLKEMRRSPLHYRHRLTSPRVDTKSLALGRAVHTAVFEPDRFALDYVVFKGAARRGREWDAFELAHTGETIIKLDEYERCLAIRDAVCSNPIAAKYLESGLPEQTIQWTDAETKLRCKGRADWLTSGRAAALVDLKTTTDVDERRFATTVARYGYHAQLAFYGDGLVASGCPEHEVIIIAVENVAPYDVAVYHLDADVLYAGREEYRALLRRVAGCRAGDCWPGRYSERQSLELPSWMFDDEDEGLTAHVLEEVSAHG